MAKTISIKRNAADSSQKSVSWLCLVIPYANKVDYSKIYDNYAGEFQRPSDSESSTDNQNLIIIEDDCINWNITGAKASPLTALNLMLVPGLAYERRIDPEDWVMFWCFNDEESLNELKQRIKDERPCNIYEKEDKKPLINIVPKFIGRVTSVVPSIQTDNSGRKSMFISVGCNGFLEFHASIFYNHAIGLKFTHISKLLDDFGVYINSIVKGGIIRSQLIIPEIINVALGKGPSKNFKTPDLSEITTNSDVLKAADKIITSPNEKYLIPPIIPKLLGVDPKNENYYSDILKIHIGVQHFESDGYSPKFKDGEKTFDNLLETEDAISGDYIPQALQFNDQTVWSVIKSFSNDPVNEMFTTIKPDDKGRYLPTIVCRQIPFSTDRMNRNTDEVILNDVKKSDFTDPPVPESESEDFAEKWGNAAEKIATGIVAKMNASKTPVVNEKTESWDFSTVRASTLYKATVTTFSELPRWEIDPEIILKMEIGKSDTAKFNYVHLSGVLPVTDPTWSAAISYSNFPPFVNKEDIRRNGLKTFIRNLNSVFIPFRYSAKEAPGSFWNLVMADILFDNHLKYTGSVTTVGIQDPICIGDNCRILDSLFHITRVAHNGAVGSDGTRSFYTTLSLENGVHIDPDPNTMLNRYVDLSNFKSLLGFNED